MHNELLFLAQIIIVALVTLGTLKRGSEALVAWVCLQTLLSDLFVTKQMLLFGLEVTCSDAFAVGTILGINLLQEFYGRQKARAAIWTSFLLSLAYVVLSNLHVAFTPSAGDWAHGHVSALMSPMPRILVASLTTYLLVELFDSRFFAYLKIRTNGKHLAARSGLALVVSQALDTTLFSVLGLWGIASSLGEIIMFSFAVKLVIVACMAPFTQVAQALMHTPQPKQVPHA